MASPDHNGDENPSRLGYFAAIFVSALGHIAIFAFVFFIAPRFLHPAEAAPPAYTVKIVDNIPAGDLGSHLPPINRHAANESKAAAPKPQEAQVKTEPHKTELAANEDKNALKINANPTEVPTDTPTPTPEPTVAPTVEPTPEPTVEPKTEMEPNLEATEEPTVAPTPEPTQQPTKHPTAKPTPAKAHNRPKSGSTVAKIASTPSVAMRMAKLRRELLEHHMKDLAENPPEEDPGDEEEVPDTPAGPAGGGPVVARNAIEGKGYGVGTGDGSAGILKDPEFLLYYKTVQDQIKKAWTFTGGSNDLTATVDFAIGPDGTLAGLKIGTSSNDGAFDDSVIRAIRRAAPFPAPPEKFRDQFSSGIKAVFQLGELKS